MTIARKLALLLALALSALAFNAVAAHAVTVTPSGTFTAVGNGDLTAPEITGGNLTCTSVDIVGNFEVTGEGVVNVTYTSGGTDPCTAFATTCDVTDSDFQSHITNTAGDFVNTTVAAGTIVCSGLSNFNCTVEAAETQVTGTVTPGDEPTIQVDATVVDPEDTAGDDDSCTGTVTGTASITAAGDQPKGTGNDLTITA